MHHWVLNRRGLNLPSSPKIMVNLDLPEKVYLSICPFSVCREILTTSLTSSQYLGENITENSAFRKPNFTHTFTHMQSSTVNQHVPGTLTSLAAPFFTASLPLISHTSSQSRHLQTKDLISFMHLYLVSVLSHSFKIPQLITPLHVSSEASPATNFDTFMMKNVVLSGTQKCFYCPFLLVCPAWLFFIYKKKTKKVTKTDTNIETHIHSTLKSNIIIHELHDHQADRQG